MQGAENYDTIKNGFSALIEEVNDMIDLGVIRIDGIDYTTNFVIGGDYKVKWYHTVHVSLHNII